MIYSESASDCIALEIKGNLQQQAGSDVVMEAETDSVQNYLRFPCVTAPGASDGSFYWKYICRIGP